MDLVCISFLAYFRLYKSKWRVLSKSDRMRTALLITLFGICFLDITINIIRERYPYITNFLRPIVVAIFLS